MEELALVIADAGGVERFRYVELASARDKVIRLDCVGSAEFCILSPANVDFYFPFHGFIIPSGFFNG